jgi:hypothetical protein
MRQLVNAKEPIPDVMRQKINMLELQTYRTLKDWTLILSFCALLFHFLAFMGIDHQLIGYIFLIALIFIATLSTIAMLMSQGKKPKNFLNGYLASDPIQMFATILGGFYIILLFEQYHTSYNGIFEYFQGKESAIQYTAIFAVIFFNASRFHNLIIKNISF